MQEVTQPYAWKPHSCKDYSMLLRIDFFVKILYSRIVESLPPYPLKKQDRTATTTIKKPPKLSQVTRWTSEPFNFKINIVFLLFFFGS